MTAVSAAVDAIFADRNMAADAVWLPAAGGAGIACRVIVNAPDADMAFGASRVTVETVRLDVRVSEVAAPARDDTVTIGGDTWQVSAQPRRDRERLVWQAEAVAAP